MARSRRRARGSMRPRLDWVYNEQAYNNLETTVTPGIANAIAFPLTVSQSARRLVTWGVDTALPGIPDYQSWAAIPEGGGQKVFAAECKLIVRPSVWAIGNDIRLGMRIIILTMDPTDGSPFVDPGYTMWATGATTTVAQWANYGFLRESHFTQSFDSNNRSWNLRLNWRSKQGRKMRPNEALYLYLEVPSTPVASVNAIVIPRCRALQAVGPGG